LLREKETRATDPEVAALAGLVDFVDTLFLIVPGLLLLLACLFVGLLWPWTGPFVLELSGLWGLFARVLCSGVGVFAGLLFGGGLLAILVHVGSFIERLPLIALGLARRIDLGSDSQTSRRERDIFDQIADLPGLPIGLIAIVWGKWRL
jgi:hypothetical protein